MLVYSKSNKKFYTNTVINIITYFLVIYYYYYFIVFEKYTKMLDTNVKKALNDKELYTKLNLSQTDKKSIDIIKNCNDYSKKDNKAYLYNFMIYCLLFIIFIVYIFLIGDYFTNEVKRILYDSTIGIIYILVIKYIFIHNVEFNYDKITTDEIYNNIANNIQKKLKK